MGWAVAGVAALAAILFYAMWQKEVRAGHCLTQFIILLFVDPSASVVQKQNFLNLLKRIDARDSTDLGIKVLLEVYHHAERVAGNFALTNSNEAAMWEAQRAKL